MGMFRDLMIFIKDLNGGEVSFVATLMVNITTYLIMGHIEHLLASNWVEKIFFFESHIGCQTVGRDL